MFFFVLRLKFKAIKHSLFMKSKQEQMFRLKFKGKTLKIFFMIIKQT